MQIVLIDLLLSGDNAVVIGVAAHPLPRRQRALAIVLGGGAAIVLRVLLTGGAALLLELPLVRFVGGLLLLWIAFRLLGQEEEDREGIKAATTLQGAVATILVADLIMSLDNVLGVAAISTGDFGLLTFGLVLSMAIVLLGGGIFADWIDRMRWLAYLGGAVIAWTGIDMIMDETAVAIHVAQPARLLLDGLVTVGLVVLAYRIHRHSRVPRRIRE
jgi:YjbE family integral membrane protein